MKKILALVLAACPIFAFAAPCELRVTQRNNTDTSSFMRSVPPVSCATSAIMMHNGGTELPVYAGVGAGLQFSGGILSATADWSAITGVPSSFAPSAHTHPASEISDSSATGRSVLVASDAAAARSAIGAGTSSFSGAYSALTGIPATFAPSAHSHAIADVTGLQTALNGKFPNPAGTSSQVVLGDGTLGSMPAQSINDAPGRSLVTSTSAIGFQVSATRNAQVCYEGGISTTSSIGGPSAGSVFLETSATNSTTPADWTIKATQTSSQTLTLALVLQSVDIEPWSICRVIPAGVYVRLRTAVSTGTVSFTINTAQQETLF